AVLYWFLLWLLGLRNRTSVLTSLLLANYSEFALIVAAMGVSAGWLSSHWLLSLVIAVSVGFIVSALVNPASVSRASQLAQRLPARPPDKIHPEDRPIDVGDATAIVLGMGRVGRSAAAQLQGEHGYRVLGVEHDPSRVQALRGQGYNVVEGDATDYDFWARVVRNGLVRVIVLAMPSQHANVEALREMRRIGYQQGTVAAVALYREDAEELEQLGLDVVVHLYAGAGEALADRSARAQAGHPAEGTGLL
ncbi:NAD-binding protein, partial [Intrasporangium sp.]|uniref:NAD-binding protein n=1 Tax=Intrasporangium sp. TaxID=1925024 RepID=UPI003221DB16